MDSNVNSAVSAVIAADKSNRIVFSKKEMIFAILSLPMGYGFVKLLLVPFLYGNMGLGAAVFLILLTVYGITFPSENNLNKGTFSVISAFSFVFSVNVFFTANNVIQILDSIFVILMFLYSMLVKCDSRLSEKIRKLFIFDMLRAVFSIPASRLSAAPMAIRQSVEKKRFGSAAKSILIGLLIAFPSTGIIILLLSEADRHFSKMMENMMKLLSIDTMFTNAFQFLLGIIPAFVIFSVCYASAKMTEDDQTDDDLYKENISKLGFLNVTTGVISVIPICVVYVAFFFTQLTYFLSAFTGKLPDGYSYADYARHGFFELFAVTIINLLIITCFNLFCRHDKDKRPVIMKAVTALMSFFTIMLVATAISKMLMYINNYGLTQLRVYTTWFMVLIAVIFLAVIIYQFVDFNLAKASVAAFFILFSVLSFSGTDHLIAKYNIYQSENGVIADECDIDMLTSLSADAAPDIASMGLNDCYEIKEYFRNIENDINKSDWRGLTVSEMIAADYYYTE